MIERFVCIFLILFLNQHDIKEKREKNNSPHSNRDEDKKTNPSEKDLLKLKQQKTDRQKHFMRHIPKGAEASNILVGSLDCLEAPVMAFVRLEEAVVIEDLCEVDIPTRFIFILLGQRDNTNYYQIGRSVSTLMSDEIFHEVAYKAKTRKDLLAGIDEFLDKTTVLPPGEWDPKIRIEPPEKLKDTRIIDRLNANADDMLEHPGWGDELPEDGAHGEDPALQKTGKLFGGLIADIKRKAPFYASDFKDAMSLQCVSSFIFLYFAIITPVITFGGLLGDATKNKISAMESIVGAAISGTIYHLFSGQPLTIIGATGPILVFDSITYSLCENYGIPFLPFRLWIGVWTGLICILLVITDASYLVKYITRYTEESFSTLISLIFITDGLKKMWKVQNANPIWWGYDQDQLTSTSCECRAPDFSAARDYGKEISNLQNKTGITDENQLHNTLRTISQTGNSTFYTTAKNDFTGFLFRQQDDFWCLYRECLTKLTINVL